MTGGIGRRALLTAAWQRVRVRAEHVRGAIRPPASLSAALEGFPVFPGAVEVERQQRRPPGSTSALALTVRYRAAAGAPAVLAFYREALPRSGWEVRPGRQATSGGTLVLRWGRYSGFLTVRPGDEATTVILYLAALAPRPSAGSET